MLEKLFPATDNHPEDWGRAYLWTAMVTAKDDDVVCRHDG